MQDLNLTFRFHRALDGLTLEFCCGKCGARLSGSYHNKDVSCPACEAGTLEPTKDTDRVVRRVWARVKSQEGKCLSGH